MKTVELRPGYVWTCEDCGRDNPGPVVLKSDGDGGYNYKMPHYVTCVFCKETFKGKEIDACDPGPT